jgi:hypothetical protein
MHFKTYCKYEPTRRKRNSGVESICCQTHKCTVPIDACFGCRELSVHFWRRREETMRLAQICDIVEPPVKLPFPFAPLHDPFPFAPLHDPFPFAPLHDPLPFRSPARPHDLVVAIRYNSPEKEKQVACNNTQMIRRDGQRIIVIYLKVAKTCQKLHFVIQLYLCFYAHLNLYPYKSFNQIRFSSKRWTLPSRSDRYYSLRFSSFIDPPQHKRDTFKHSHTPPFAHPRERANQIFFLKKYIYALSWSN